VLLVVVVELRDLVTGGRRMREMMLLLLRRGTGAP
jgi:hypothetical protein